MSTEQPDVGSEASIGDRLNAFFGGPEAATETAAPETEQPVAESTQSETEDAPEVEAAPVDDGLVDIEDEDGGKYRVSQKLRDERLRWKDYTEKTQDVSRIRAAADDRLQYAEAREKIAQVLSSEMGNLSALQAQRKQFDAIDFGTLYRTDAGQAMALRDQRDMLDRQIADVSQSIQAKTSQAQQILSQHQAKQWDMAVEGAKQRIGQYTPADDAAMLAEVRKMGFDDSELRGRFADARFLHLVHKAAKWDALQSGKTSAIEAAKKAPPVVKPGAASARMRLVSRSTAKRGLRSRKAGICAMRPGFSC